MDKNNLPQNNDGIERSVKGGADADRTVPNPDVNEGGFDIPLSFAGDLPPRQPAPRQTPAQPPQTTPEPASPRTAPAQNGKTPMHSAFVRPGSVQGEAPSRQTTPVTPAVKAQTPPQSAPVRPTPDRSTQPPQQSSYAKNAPTQNISVPVTPQPKLVNEMTREVPDGGLNRNLQSRDTSLEADAPSLPGKQKKVKTENRGKKESSYSETSNSIVSLIKCMVYITAVLMVSTLISVCVIFAANDIFAFVKSDETMEIEIPEGADFDDVADILHDNGIIKYKFLFKTYMGSKVKNVSFESGSYTLSPMTSYSDLVYILREKPPTGISYITIPEGYTTDEIIDLMVSHGIGAKEKYIDVINNYDFDYWFIDELGEDWAADGRIYRLDGYLFPDSYEFYNASSEVTVINKLLARFDDVFTDNYKEAAAELNYTVDEILVIASMIEKEGGNRADFGYVSSVFHNRLNSPTYFPCLESDATIAYVLHHETGKRPVLTGKDLELDSPYNSYKNPGLSPGPIANPSNSAIIAALNPFPTNYYFFISDGAKTYFSTTKAEHDAYKQQIQNRTEQ